MNEKKPPDKLVWDDLKTVMAIARARSLSGAARDLAVSHATVFRRLGDIERRLGVRLFDRARGGYAATPAGEDVAAAAERVEAEVLGVERRLEGQDLRPTGTVRITTTDTLLFGLLSPVFAAFREAHPEIALEVAASNALFNLPRREADLAIRPTLEPPDTLTGRRIGTITHAVYGRAGGVHPRKGMRGLHRTDWIGPAEGLPFPALEAWMTEQGVAQCCRYRADTVMGMLAAVRDDIGLAMLPCYLGSQDERLVQLGNPIPEMATELWLLTHPDLRRAARIRALIDFVVPRIARALPEHR